jgi:hypothetical protein
VVEYNAVGECPIKEMGASPVELVRLTIGRHGAMTAGMVAW